MLDQVIYTRCMPRRDLKRNGVVSRMDGFGVFSMSQSIFSPEKKIDFSRLQVQLSKQNGAKENSAVGLFNSYEYAPVSDSTYALTYEVARPQCQIPRKNGHTHRSGTYIKQSLVGELKGYPCEFFGAGCWDACQKGENDYYLDDDPNAEPAWLPQVSAAPVGGTVTRDKVRDFVRDGRAEAVKTAVWFLIGEFSKPVGERKVLLIKDIPSNVELWVAAIEYAFSADMAKQISFTTNRTNLANQTETVLFHYTDAAGKFYPTRAGGGALTRTPYCMIVGFHPQDQHSASLRQMQNSNFVLLDGTAKSLNIPTDDAIREPYYEALVQYDADIGDFCGTLLPNLPLKQISDELPDLFDAYKYLLDSNHGAEKWGYSGTMAHLECLLRHGLPTHHTLNEYLLDACIRAYPGFAERDEAAKYPLLKMMRKLAAALNREQDVTDCVAKRIVDALGQLNTHGDELCRSWRAAESGGIVEMIRPVLRDMFKDSELTRYSGQFAACGVDTISTVMDMYLAVISGEPDGLSSLTTQNARYKFICDALARLSDNRREAVDMLRKLSRAGNLFYAVSIAVGGLLDREDPRKAAAWWETVTDASGGNTLDLCKRLCAYNKTKIELVEKLLCEHIVHTGRCSRETQIVFSDAVSRLSAKNDTGLDFFRTWIGRMKLSDTSDIVTTARSVEISRTTAKEIFQCLDHAVGPEIMERENERYKKALMDWSKELGVHSKTISFGQLHRDLDRARRAHDVIDTVREFGEKRYPADAQFVESEYFCDIALNSCKLESPELTLELLLAFQFDSERAYQEYVDEYVKIAMDTQRGGARIRQMVVLTEAMMMIEPRRGARGRRVNEVQSYLAGSLKKRLPDYVRAGDADRIEDYRCDKSVKEELQRMIKNSGRNNPAGGVINDFLGGIGDLFRKGRK